MGCADIHHPTTTSSGEDDAATSLADEAGVNEGEEEEPLPWAQTALGPYYLDLGFPLPPARYIGDLVNIELRSDTLLVTHLQCTGEEHTERFVLNFEGDEAFVRPKDGETWLMWKGEPVAKGLVIRPGLTCAKLVSEFIDPVSPRGSFAKIWSWRRGAVVVTDMCIDGFEWAADVSPQVSTACPDGAADD